MEEITTKSISALLTDAMRIKNMSVEKLSQVTGISDRFLGLLLEERFNKLPSTPYVRGYVLKIGEVLSIDGNELWEIIKSHHTQTVAKSGEKDILPKNRFKVEALNIKIIIGGVIGIIFFIFLLFRIPALLGKPKFELYDIQDGMKVTTSTLSIRGTINPSDELFINDEQIVANEKGDFEKTIELTPDFNTLHFTVKGLLGKELQETKQIFYEAPKVEAKKKVNESSTEPINIE
ncbi:MAG: Uncharacterized protein LiPW41_95 [Parcubacteria group bacterium LiPW_41]|nr:MAG: Uncharacterized protein LiPW41_95 [Parcubacteria group bacterium LiPW_41]